MRFIAETGERVLMAESIERWAGILLLDYAKEAGWLLASKWQSANGPLSPGKRLMPKVPFFLGGKYSIENLWAGSAVEGMRLKGDLAIQTRNLPDGTDVRLTIAKKPAAQ